MALFLFTPFECISACLLLSSIVPLVTSAPSTAVPLRTRHHQHHRLHQRAFSSDADSSSIPDYVLQYAPLVWLALDESYMPSDIGSQLSNTIPELNDTVITAAPDPLTLDNLSSLDNNPGGIANIYLTSTEGIEADPDWFHGITPDSSFTTVGATSCAIITVAKDGDVLDAFFFYFYAYNQGNEVLGIEFGDHVGDWEHNMVRFNTSTGLPTAVWFSQHQNGEAFTYDAVEKNGIRPVGYVATGTHANYAITGTHDHTIPDLNLPEGFVEDHCSQGTVWDPTLAAYEYSYDIASQTFTAWDGTAPVDWLYFMGRWGDEQLPADASGQIEVFGEAKYVAGPTGPWDKNIGRTAVCFDETDCVISDVLTV